MYRLSFIALLVFCSSVAAQPIDSKADMAGRNSRAKAQSHCIADEIPVFTCKIGKKIASICASKVLNENSGYLQYRFGEKHKVELEIPPTENYKPALVGYKSATCASCYANYLRFTSGDFRYYVFNASVRGQNDPKSGASTRHEPSGVVVAKGDKFIFSRQCNTPAFDHNFGEHFWGNAVLTLGVNEGIDPFEIALPTE